MQSAQWHLQHLGSQCKVAPNAKMGFASDSGDEEEEAFAGAANVYSAYNDDYDEEQKHGGGDSVRARSYAFERDANSDDECQESATDTTASSSSAGANTTKRRKRVDVHDDDGGRETTWSMQRSDGSLV